MSKKPNYQFQKDFEGNLIPLNIGRLVLGKGSIVRIFLDSEGLHFAIPKKAQDNGEIIWVEDIEYNNDHQGLGIPVKKT